MSGTLAKIAEIEAEMARTQKNKATAHHLGLLKARLAKLRRELITPKGGGGGGPGEGQWPREGVRGLGSDLYAHRQHGEVSPWGGVTMGRWQRPRALQGHGGGGRAVHGFLTFERGLRAQKMYPPEFGGWKAINGGKQLFGQDASIPEKVPVGRGQRKRDLNSLPRPAPFGCPAAGGPSFPAIADPSPSFGACPTLGFDVAKTGDARIGFVGFPSVGKSTLLSNLAGVYSEVAAYEFTTLTTVPGVIRYKGAKIQLLDLPGIIEGAKDGKGRGRQVIAVARTCNLILIVLDVLKPLGHKKIIENELEGFGIRLNSKPPNIGFKKKDKGGINLTATCPQSELDAETVKSILAEYKIHNADVTLRSDATADDLIDVVEGNRVYIPCIYVLNKIDQISIEELDIIYKVPHCVPISAHHRWNFDDLLERIWDYLRLVRIYTKPKGQLPDYTSPVVLPDSRTTVEDFCMKIHKNLIKEFKYALVWGLSVKHNPQKVGKDHTLEDEDVIQIVKK
uniref:Developmentally-regulated GTP-binding protein 1 n=1 Tax=Sarcophilus harrisii TaxID=9305 RepID=A0A7N4P4H6_SARHA